MAAVVVPPGFIGIAGNNVPVALVPRLIASIRGMYPELTADLSDNKAVTTVIRFWMTENLKAWEVKVAATQGAANVDQALAAVDVATAAAHDAAATDASAIQLQ